MALTFFWRCESAALDATHDYSAGATTMTAAGAVSASATAVKIGTNGVLTTDGTDYYYCDPTGIVDIDQGSFGFWYQSPAALVTNSNPIAVGAEQTTYSTTGNYLMVRAAAGGDAQAATSKAGPVLITKETTTAAMTTGAWYFVTMSWHLSADKLRVRVYDSTGALIDDADNDTDLTDLSTAIPASIDRFFVGRRSSSTAVVYVDNVFVGNSYDDADTFLTKRNITSYTQYADGHPAQSRTRGIPGMNSIASRFGRGW